MLNTANNVTRTTKGIMGSLAALNSSRLDFSSAGKSTRANDSKVDLSGRAVLNEVAAIFFRFPLRPDEPALLLKQTNDVAVGIFDGCNQSASTDILRFLL